MSDRRSLKGQLKKAAVSLSLAFSCVALPPAFAQAQPSEPAPAPQRTAITKEAGLWKVEYIDAVVEIKPCAGKPACTSFYWVNPAKEDIYGYFGDPNIRLDRNDEGTTIVTQKDILSLCGFAPNMDMQAAENGAWEGKLEVRGWRMNVSINVSMLNDNELKVEGSKLFLSHEEVWKRISPNDSKYPRCKKPAP